MYDFDYIRSVDIETISWMKEKMMEAYRGAVSYLNAGDREYAHPGRKVRLPAGAGDR